MHCIIPKWFLMFFSFIRYLPLAFLPLIIGILLNPVAVQAATPAIYPKEILRIEFLSMDRLKNGQTVQRFTVHAPLDFIGPVTVLYLENKDPVIYRATPVNGSFAINVNKSSRIRIFAFAKDLNKSYVTCTDLVLFGESKIPPTRVPAAIMDASLLRDLPHISLKNATSYYWHQTGIPLIFALVTAVPGAPPGLSVFKNNHTNSLIPEPAQPSWFVYTPSHDKRLKKSGGAAVRQEILFTHMVQDGTQYHLAYALQVHRSVHGHDSHKAGVLTLTAGFFLFTGILLKERKKTWWKE